MLCRTAFCGLGFVCLLTMNGFLLPCSVHGIQTPFPSSKIIHAAAPPTMIRGMYHFHICLANGLHSSFLWFLPHVAVGPAIGQCTAEMRSPGVQKRCPMAHNVALVGVCWKFTEIPCTPWYCASTKSTLLMPMIESQDSCMYNCAT